MPSYPLPQGDKSIMGPACLSAVDHEAQSIKARVGLDKISLNELMIIDEQLRTGRVRAAFAESIKFDDDAL